MERDFLGLGSKNVAAVTVKEEVIDGSKDSVARRGSEMHWSFSNKVSAIPQFLSLKAGVEDRPRKTVHDPIASSAFMPVSTADAYDSNQKQYSAVVKKNVTLDKQAGNHYAMTTTYCTKQFDSYPVHRPQETRIFPFPNQQNQTITVSMSTPVLQSHLTSVGHNVFGNVINSPPLGGVPVVTPVSVLPATSSIVGTNNLRNGSKSSGAPAQLTIFYAGSVCVYNDVSPEKAEAIMLLAANGSSVTHNKAISTTQAHAPIPRSLSGDAYVGNKIITASPSSSLPNPISLTSTSVNELATAKPTIPTSANHTELPKSISSARPASETLIPAVAVPQARKASLARFLEKRKERVTNTSPYKVSKKSENITSGSNGMSLSINSSSSVALRGNN